MALGRGLALVYTATGLVLATQPLFGILHVESSAVVAGVAFFAAGGSILGRRVGLGEHLWAHAMGLSIPWAILSVTLLWRPNCEYLVGLGFYGLFVLPSLGLGSALAYALAATTWKWKRLIFGVLGLGIATLPVLYDLGFHPQFYTYNHVWGGVLGPIYDEELAIRPGLFAFRALTVLWAISFVALGHWLRSGSGQGRTWPFVGAAASALLVLGYAFGPPLGINTSYTVLERSLTGRVETSDFVLHYDATSLKRQPLAALQDELAYRHASLEEALGVAPNAPIHVYLYPDGETRARLTGSRRTSVTPVWLARPQLHMLQEALTPDEIGHELVHVFSREFGLPLLNASLAVGLVEGLAVALEPPDGFPSPEQQVAATMQMQADSLGALAGSPSEAMIGAMSPFGFWTGRGAVSYVTTGAFAGWLLDRYGPEAMRRVYASGNFEDAYGQPLAGLAQSWEADLSKLPPSGDAASIARWRFSQPSLFERRCPHHVPPAVRWTRRARTAEEAGDLSGAMSAYERALAADSAYAPALVGWATRTAADFRDPEAAIERLRRYIANTAQPTAIVYTALGDAHVLRGDTAQAATAYEEAIRELPPWADGSRAFLKVRQRLSPVALAQLLRLGDRAARMDERAGHEPAVRPFASWLWQERGDFARAYAVLAPWEPEVSSPHGHLVAREVLAWKADAARRARQYEDALALAVRARRRMADAGKDGRVRQLDDQIAQAQWHLAHP